MDPEKYSDKELTGKLLSSKVCGAMVDTKVWQDFRAKVLAGELEEAVALLDADRVPECAPKRGSGWWKSSPPEQHRNSAWIKQVIPESSSKHTYRIDTTIVQALHQDRSRRILGVKSSKI